MYPPFGGSMGSYRGWNWGGDWSQGRRSFWTMDYPRIQNQHFFRGPDVG